jgi:hypothetical protein
MTKIVGFDTVNKIITITAKIPSSGEKKIGFSY